MKRQVKVDRKFYPPPSHPGGGSRPERRQGGGDLRSGGGRGGISGGAHRPRRERLSIEQLMKVTRCKKCRKKGHWSRECPENKQSSTSGFVFLNEPSADASGLVLATLSEVVKRCEEALR
eukprot:9501083-Pyramimonas_sp.AAC.1